MAIRLIDTASLMPARVTQASRQGLKAVDVEGSLDNVAKAVKLGSKPRLEAVIHATHSGVLVNRRVYPGRRMELGATSWVKPYARPVQADHEGIGGTDPKVFGRVVKAEFVRLYPDLSEFSQDWRNPDLNGGHGSGFIRLRTVITDAEAIDGILAS